MQGIPVGSFLLGRFYPFRINGVSFLQSVKTESISYSQLSKSCCFDKYCTFVSTVVLSGISEKTGVLNALTICPKS
jgi:hypothetical protein